MEHNRSTKVVAMVALLVAVLGLSVGFSAYSKTLNIQNVQATVKGNASNFDVVFSTASNSASDGEVTGSKVSDAPSGEGGTATLTGTTISDLTASFSSTGGQVMYSFYVYNKGSIPAYLTAITFGAKSCKGVTGTNNELVTKACGEVAVSVKVGTKTYSATSAKITDSTALAAKTGVAVEVLITKNAGTAVDGDFTATIPTITLNYSSQNATA